MVEDVCYTKEKQKKEKKEIPCPADLVFLGDFTYVDYGREVLTNYGRPNYGRTSLTIYGREMRTNYGRLNYRRTLCAFMGEIKRQKRERVVSVLYQLDWLHVIESTGRLSVVPLVARWARNARANKAWGSLTIRAQERTLH